MELNKYNRLVRRLRFWRGAIALLILTTIALPFTGLVIVLLNWPVEAGVMLALAGIIVSTEVPITLLINNVMHHIKKLNKQEYIILYTDYKKKGGSEHGNIKKPMK